MKQFIFSYWKELISLILALATLLICLFRKKGKEDPVGEFIFNVIPSIVKSVEDKIGKGQGKVKKDLCMKIVSTYFKKLTGLDLVKGSSLYEDYSHFIEDVLSAPQKKGN